MWFPSPTVVYVMLIVSGCITLYRGLDLFGKVPLVGQLYGVAGIGMISTGVYYLQ